MINSIVVVGCKAAGMYFQSAAKSIDFNELVVCSPVVWALFQCVRAKYFTHLQFFNIARHQQSNVMLVQSKGIVYVLRQFDAFLLIVFKFERNFLLLICNETNLDVQRLLPSVVEKKTWFPAMSKCVIIKLVLVLRQFKFSSHLLISY